MATQTRYPTGIGYTDGWTANTGSKVDAVQSNDGDTTYITRSGNTQAFTYTAFDINASSIEKVSITAVNKDVTIGTALRGFLRIGGVTYGWPGFATPDGVYEAHSVEWLTNPAAGSAWQEEDVEGTGSNPLQQFGVNAYQVGYEVWVTELYITVTYTAAAGGTALATSINMQSNTPDSALIVGRSMAAVNNLQSNTPDGVLAVPRSLIASNSVQSVTPDAILAVERAMAAALAMVSNTPDAELLVPGDGILSAVINLQSYTPFAALTLERTLSSALSAQNRTPDAQLTIARLMAAQIAGDTNTPDAVLAVARSLFAIANAKTNTPNADLIISALGSITAPSAVSVTPDREALSVTPNRELVSRTPVRSAARV